MHVCAFTPTPTITQLCTHMHTHHIQHTQDTFPPSHAKPQKMHMTHVTKEAHDLCDQGTRMLAECLMTSAGTRAARA